MFKIVMRTEKKQIKKKIYDKEMYFDKSWEGFSDQVDFLNSKSQHTPNGLRGYKACHLLAYQMDEHGEYILIGAYYGKGSNKNVFSKVTIESDLAKVKNLLGPIQTFIDWAQSPSTDLRVKSDRDKELFWKFGNEAKANLLKIKDGDL